jgi:glycosyltransferase involved in cell wall biosynthesis
VDLAVFPSVAPEAFGLVAAEAMSIGCPYVISDAGALPEVAGDHPYVAAAGDAEALPRKSFSRRLSSLKASGCRFFERQEICE